MADDKMLTDTEAYDRMHAALEALGTAQAEMPYAKAALETARQSLRMLQFAILTAQENRAMIKSRDET